MVINLFGILIVLALVLFKAIKYFKKFLVQGTSERFFIPASTSGFILENKSMHAV